MEKIKKIRGIGYMNVSANTKVSSMYHRNFEHLMSENLHSDEICHTLKKHEMDMKVVAALLEAN